MIVLNKTLEKCDTNKIYEFISNTVISYLNYIVAINLCLCVDECYSKMIITRGIVSVVGVHIALTPFASTDEYTCSISKGEPQFFHSRSI